jgi:Restriction endonuclease NaeI
VNSGPIQPPRGQAVLPGITQDPVGADGQRVLPGLAGLGGAQHAPGRDAQGTAANRRLAAGDADPELNRVAAELLAIDPDGSRIGGAVRGALDMLLDGQHTGRYRWDQLCKTENLIPNRELAVQDSAAGRSASRNNTHGWQAPAMICPQITHLAAAVLNRAETGRPIGSGKSTVLDEATVRTRC